MRRAESGRSRRGAVDPVPGRRPSGRLRHPTRSLHCPAVGLVQELGYVVPEPNRFQRAMWKVSSSRPGAWLFAKTIHHVDNFVLRVTKDRVTVPEIMAGIPVLTLVTTGARTGLRRELPLLGVPAGDAIAVIGTRFGQRGTPGWYFNLVAHPEAEISYRGTTVPVRGREAEGAEREAIWTTARSIYAGYEAYARRIDDRPVHVMVLEPAART
jgi:deazaflavin-dependent oxidoreductase (nitroreductase family)